MSGSKGTNVPVWARHLLLGAEWAPQPRSENADQRIMARLAGTVAAGISVLFAVVALLPAASDDRMVVAIASLVPLGATVVYFRVGDRLPTWADDVGGVGAAVTLAVLMVHGGPLSPTLPAIYLLLGTAEMAMRVPSAATFHFSTLATSYGVALWLAGESQPLIRWVCLAGAMLTCGIFVRLMMSTVLTLTFTEKTARADAEETSVELADASAERTEFLSRMSHELRTPLNAIIGFADVLRGGYGGRLSNRQVDYVEDIADAGRQLLALVDDVLDLSQVEHGSVELQPTAIELEHLVAHSLSTIEAVAHRAGVEIRSDVRASCPVRIDERRLGQVLLNLLSNGIRFAGDGGQVTIRSDVHGDRAVIRVEDTGPGVSSEDRERIFERYQQADDVRDGTGLGLPVARTLVEAHGGRLELDPSYDAGAAFVCDIPVAGPDPAPADSPPRPSEANPYEAFTDPGSLANRVLVARAGAWFAACSAIFAAVIAIVADASWTTRMGFAGGAIVAATTAIVTARTAHRLTTMRIALFGLVFAVALNVLYYNAPAFRDVAILPFAWLSLTGWSLLRNRAYLISQVALLMTLHAVVLWLGPDDPLVSVRFATAAFLAGLAAVVARFLVTELAHALEVERRARAEADELRYELEAALRHKSEFMASMSHELRAPLNAILGFADVLSDGYAGTLDRQQQQYVDDVRGAGKQLLSLLNDILDLAKLEAQRERPGLEPMCARVLVDAAVARHVGPAGERGVRIEVSGPDSAPMLGDPRLVGSAVENLLANAVKFSPDGHPVGVVLRCDGGAIAMEVTDEGIGIHEAQLARIFDPFHQGTAPIPDHARGGTGLGLALALAIARLHGGDVHVRSRVGGGSTFTLRLPGGAGWIPAAPTREEVAT